MNFSNTHKAFAIALSLLVLFSTLSLTIEKHFCGGTLIDVAIFSETVKCLDDIIEMDDISIIKKNCCKDEIDVIEGLSESTINSFEELDSLQKHFLFAYTHSYINLFDGIPNLVIPHKDYSPPILVKDLQVLDETYLI